MQSIPFSAARAHLAETLHQIEEANTPLMISRRGQGAGVLMSVAQYRQLVAPSQSFSARLANWRATQIDGTDDAPDEFESLRDRSSGRDFSW